MNGISWTCDHLIFNARYYRMYWYDADENDKCSREHGEGICFIFNEGYMEEFSINQDTTHDLDKRVNRMVEEIRDLI